MTDWAPRPAMAAYRAGVTVVCELAAQFTEASWAAPTPCTEWRAADLAGHLRCVADDFHEYLDEAPESRLARLMATGASAETLGLTLARQNAAELAELPDVSPREHIAAFAESARSYARRLPSAWNLPHHRYRGVVVSVGGMAGVACAEWHLHAWDLARSLGKEYRPADPHIVVAGWWAGMPQLRRGGEPEPPGCDAARCAQEPARADVPRRGDVPYGADMASGPDTEAARDPWESLVRSSGRDPGWSP